MYYIDVYIVNINYLCDYKDVYIYTILPVLMYMPEYILRRKIYILTTMLCIIQEKSPS